MKNLSKEVSFPLAKLLFGKFEHQYGNLYWFKDINQMPPKLVNSKPHLSHEAKGVIYYSAPTIAEVVDWIYEKDGVWIEVRKTYLFKQIRFQSYINEKPLTGELGRYVSQETPSEAYEKAIEHYLTNVKK